MPKDTIRKDWDLAQFSLDLNNLGDNDRRIRIADWWIQKMEAHNSDIAKHIEEILPEGDETDWASYRWLKDDLLRFLSPSSDNKQDNENT